MIIIKKSDIHSTSEKKGLHDYEIRFLELTQRLMSGSKFEINKDKTVLKYYPGILMNNNDVEFEFDCGLERSMSYFLEPVLIMAMFAKSNLQLILTGITNDEIDLSVKKIEKK